MRKFAQAIIFNQRALLVLYILAAVITSVQLVLLGTHLFRLPDPATTPPDMMNHIEIMNQFVGRPLTEYNNYLIFKCSWFHLLHGTNLYGLYPAEHWDFFKYSPTFALFMGLLAYLPDIAGLIIWNTANVIAVYVALRMLPFSYKHQCILLWFVGNELLTSLSSSQSNGLMCGLMILAYACMEQRKVLWATLCLVFATYIKVYGIIGCCLFLFYPDKLKFILYMALWSVLFAVLPLAVTPLHTLIWQYHNWTTLMMADAAAATGMSVMGWLHTWFGVALEYGKYVTLAGMILFLIPFIKWKLYRNEVYKLLTLASMLIWVIIFNHKAESPTYVVAIAGVGIWYYAMPRAKWRTFLLFFVLIFTSFSATDLFPPYVKLHFVRPYTIKAFPCIVVWAVVFAELLLLRPQQAPPEKPALN